jgi:colicin import membrane protein
MRAPQTKKYLIASCVFHAVIFFAIVASFEMASPLVVVENTNQHDVISAVVLGDSAKSKILPHEDPAPQPVPKPKPEKIEPPKPIVKNEPKPEPAKKVVDKNVIALKAKKLDEKKKKHDEIAKALLADIKKQKDKKQKPKKNELSEQFAKMLKKQSEESLRQNLLNENIKLRGKLSRQSQGVVDKYKALIIQSIGEQWLVPLQANKKLTSELMIRLAPDGKVLDVEITKSSGDPALDSSARAAVRKASPLPVPSNPSEFEPFRQFVLKVKPENIVES